MYACLMKKLVMAAAAAGILALSACQIDPPGVIDERTKTPDGSHWENKCTTNSKGKQDCRKKWDYEPERCEVHVKLDDGGTMWREFDCNDWDLYKEGSRYPKDKS